MGKTAQLVGGMTCGGIALYKYGINVPGITSASLFYIAGKEIVKLTTKKKNNLNNTIEELVNRSLAWIVSALLIDNFIPKVCPQLSLSRALLVTALGTALNYAEDLSQKSKKYLSKKHYDSINIAVFEEWRKIYNKMSSREEYLVDNVRGSLFIAGILLTAASGLKALGYIK